MLFSDYIVYVDESGDHSLDVINPEFPLFVLAFCIFNKGDFLSNVAPEIQKFKFKYFGHDLVILHEADIRKQHGKFVRLRNPVIRAPFFDDLNRVMENAPFTIIASVIRKDLLKAKYISPDHVYHLAMEFGLERLGSFLSERSQEGRQTHIMVECRGAVEDKDLELQFRRICDGRNYRKQQLPFEIVFADKKTNSIGLQFADLVARPIGRKVLDPPEQYNRAWEILEKKLYRFPGYRGMGLKVFP